MKMRMLSVFIIFIFHALSGVSSPFFETDTCVFSSSLMPNKLCVQSKTKGLATWSIDLPGSPRSIVADKHFAYILYVQNRLLTVVDLLKQTKKKDFNLSPSPKDILLDNGLLYVVYSRTDRISLVDPQTEQELMEFTTGRKPTQITRYKNFAWIVNEESRFITLIDLTKRKLLPTLLIPNCPRHVCFYEDIAYIFCANDHLVHVYDLLKQNLIRTVKIPYGSSRMEIKEGMVCINGKPEFPVFPHSRRLGRQEVLKAIETHASLSEGAFSVDEVPPLATVVHLKDALFLERITLLKESARLFKNELYDYLLPEEILMLIHLMDDKAYLGSIDWIIMRRKIYQKLCLRLWMGHTNLSKRLITHLLLYDDPQIKKIVSKVYRQGLWGVKANPKLAAFYTQPSTGMLSSQKP